MLGDWEVSNVMDERREDGQVGRHVGCIDLGRFWLNDQTERRWLVVSQASSGQPAQGNLAPGRRAYLIDKSVFDKRFQYAASIPKPCALSLGSNATLTCLQCTYQS